MQTPDTRWAPFPWFLLRATGMPFDWLEGAGAPLLWSLDAPALDAATAHARGRLAALLDHPLVAEALFLSNPALDAARIASWRESLTRPERRSKDRARERTVWRYLQRFCAKNDTTSFFGATSLGRFDAPGSTHPTLPIAANRRAFLEHWAAQALVDAAITDFDGATADGWVTHPRRAPNVQVDPDRVTHTTATDAPRHWDGATFVAAAQLADGVRDEAALAAAVSAATGCPPSAAATAVTTLLREGGLEAAAQVATGAMDALDDVRAAIARQPEGATKKGWVDYLAATQHGLDGFAGASPAARHGRFTALEAGFEERADVAARRTPGEFYASRTIVHEVGDRSGGPVALEGRVAAALETALTPLVELCALHTLADRLTFRAWFEREVGPGEHSFAAVDRAHRRDGVRVQLAAPPAARELLRDLGAVRDAFRAQVDAHVGAHGLDRPLQLDPAPFAAVRARWDDLAAADGAAYANPDLLVGDQRATGGPLRVVVGDIHAMPYLTPALFAAAPQGEVVFQDTRDWLAALCAPALPALPAVERRSFMAFEPDLGQVALEVDGRPAVPHERRASMEALRIAATGDGFQLTVETYDGARREVMPLVRAANVMSRFSRLVQLSARVHPVRLVDVAKWLAATGWRSAADLPRLLWGGGPSGVEVVVARRRFQVPSEAWASAPDLGEALRRLAAVTGGALPRFCFTKAPSEPKPLLVDWANPVAAEMALWLARREPELGFVEMLPEPAGLWLGGPDGRHTSELRVVFARSPAFSS